VSNIPVSPIETLASAAAQAESSEGYERPSKRARSEVLASPQYGTGMFFANASRPATSHIPSATWGRNVEEAINNARPSASNPNAKVNPGNVELTVAESLLELFHSNTPRIGTRNSIDLGQAQPQPESPIAGSNGFSSSVWTSMQPYNSLGIQNGVSMQNGLASSVNGVGSPEDRMEGIDTSSAVQTHTPPEENGLSSAQEIATVDTSSAPHTFLDTALRNRPTQDSTEQPPNQLHSPQSLPSASELEELKPLKEQLDKALCGDVDSSSQGLGISVSSVLNNNADVGSSQAEIPDSQATVPAVDDGQTTMGEDTKCGQCGFFANSLAGETIHWTQCDGCERWFHLSCTKIKAKEISRIDKYFCVDCEKVHGPPTFFRKSARNRTNVDYKGLNEGTFSTIEEDYEHRYIKHFKDGTLKYVTPENFPRLRPEQVTAEYLERLPNFSEPIIIPANLNPRPSKTPGSVYATLDDYSFSVPEEAEDSDEAQEVASDDAQDKLDMVIPEGLTVRRVAEIHGPEMPLEVIDVKAQEGDETKKWTLGKWADYYESPGEKPIRNVISLEVSRSPLGRILRRPRAVRDLDLQDMVWPDSDLSRVMVKFYVLMSVADCYTDFHIDFGGSSVFYHIVRGRKVFFFIPPTPSNMRKYEQWNKTAAQNHTFLADQTKECYRVDLYPGDTMLIPSGWIHAVWTPSDSLVIGGNFLTRLHLGMQIKVMEIEKNCGVTLKYRYPHFQKVMWYLLLHYLETDPIPASLEHQLLSERQPFSRNSPIWASYKYTDSESLDPELFNARYYAKSEMEGWADLVQFLYRTALIFHDRIDGMTKEKRAAVVKSIPKTSGDPLDLVRRFAAWVAWKMGNVLPPDWALTPQSTPPVRPEVKVAEKEPGKQATTMSKKNSERTSHRLGPKKVVCDTCREKKIACKHVDPAGLLVSASTTASTTPTSTNFVNGNAHDSAAIPTVPTTPKALSNGSVEMDATILDATPNGSTDHVPMATGSGKRDRELGRLSVNSEGKRRWGKACVDCRRSKVCNFPSLFLISHILNESLQRRCIHDESGKVDPNKQNAPSKGESRSKRKSTGVGDDDQLLHGQELGDDSGVAMDLDLPEDYTIAVDPNQDDSSGITNSVEDADIDPALLNNQTPIKKSASSPPVNANEIIPLSHTNGPVRRTPHKQPTTSPMTTAASPSRHSARANKSTGTTRTSPSSGSVVNTGKRSASATVGMSMSPPASAKKATSLPKNSLSPTIPHGLSPEEEASLRVAIQLQAEEFGLRNRRGQSSA
jgi:F-box and leucine-rich repeat protein 10/11